ncbi:Ig-like domain-containing protein [Deinococcus koreensis]|uniref:DUF11 domain-containing protein n=1 Tax=Deinococcus koreensis TaxID=2054903 RepID=A0A2K3V0S1_9DEIO|nr:Ig-like domain-containing protein [Deinococcus koreensis]PNY82379.1 hypothetical protein CVO96_14365 [Deinococcus koreensis]
MGRIAAGRIAVGLGVAALALGTPAAAQAGNACTLKGGTLTTNLFQNGGTFGTIQGGVLATPTRSPLSGNRTGYTFNTRPATASGNYSPEDGEYEIANSTFNRRDGAWHKLSDHTGSAGAASSGNVNGQMMVVNASFSPGVFYQETLNVVRNTNYNFGLWIVNLIAQSAGAIRPDVSLEVDRIGVDDDNNPATADGAEGQTIATTGPISYSAAVNWFEKSGLLNSGDATRITVRFRNSAPGGGGNDLAIDDLSFTTCTFPVQEVGGVSGTLFVDTNANNTLESADTRLGANVAVELRDAGGVIVATAQTDANGEYRFSTIPVGAYTVRAVLPDPNIPPGSVLRGGNDRPVTVTGGGSATLNFPFGQPLSCGAIYVTTGPQLGLFNPATGAVTSLGVTLPGQSFAAAIDPISKRFYSIGTQVPGGRLAVYDAASGQNALTGVSFPNTSQIRRAAFDRAGLGYALADDGTLYTFTTATPPVVSSRGVVSGLGGYNGGDIAIDTQGAIWVVTARNSNNQQALVRIVGTAASEIGTITEGGAPLSASPTNIGSAAFGADGALYIARGGGGLAYTLDLATAAATPLGGTGTGSSDFASCALPSFAPALKATKSVSPAGAVAAGGTLTYTVEIENSGTGPASGVTFADPLPAGTSYVPNSATLNGTNLNAAAYPYPSAVPVNGRGGAPGVVLVGNAARATLTYAVLVSASSPPASVSNQGRVTFDGGPAGGVPTDDPAQPGGSDPTVTPVTPNQPPTAQDVTNVPLPSSAGPTTLSGGLQASDPDGSVVSFAVVTLPAAAQGVLSLADGTPVTAGQVLTPEQAAGLRFDPAPGSGGTATFTYTATDNRGALDGTPATYTIPLQAVPVANPDSVTTPFGQPVTLNPAVNDTATGAPLDPRTIDLDPATPGQQTSVTVPGQGTFQLQPDGTVTFTPAPGFTGTATVPYTIGDSSGLTSTPSTISVTVGTPPPPVAKDDSAITPANTPVTLTPPANDTASPGTSLVPGSIDLDPATPGQQTAVTVPGKGTFEAQPNGSVTFTPAPGFSGTVSVPYTLQDSLGQTSNPANLTVTVPAPPVARDDAATAPYGQGATLTPPANDSASPGTALVPGSVDLDPGTPGQQTSITIPGKGTFELQPDGTVAFTPAPGFTGSVSTPYSVQDTLGQTSPPATLTVTTEPPAPPVATADSAQTPLNTPVTLTPADNDTTAPGTTLDPRSIDLDPATPGQQTSVTVPGQGTFELQPDGTVKFTPAPGFTGTATTPYTIQNSLGQPSNPAILTVTVLPLPSALDDSATTPQNTPVTLPATGNDAPNSGATIVPGSIDLDPATPGQQTAVTVPGQGTFEAQPDGSVKFTPEPGFTGVAEVPYTVRDTTGGTTNPARISVTVVGPPVAKDDSASTPLNTPVTLNPPANDTGTDLDPKTIDLDPGTPGQQTSVTIPGKGTFELQPDGTVKFTPVGGFAGTVTAPYTISDALGQTSNPATLSVTIIAPPVAKDDAASGVFDQPVKLTPPANDTASPGATLLPGSIDLDPATPGQQTAVTVPGKGTFRLDPATGDVTFTPLPGFSGPVSVPYTIGDSLGQTSNPATLTVTTLPPPAPVASPDSASTPIDTPVSLTPALNDSGTGLDPRTIDLDPGTPGQQTSVTVPGQGTFELQPDGTVKFTPAPGFTGTSTVPYTIEDALGQTSNPATLQVTVSPLPFAANDSAQTPLNTPVTVSPLANDLGRPGVPLDPKTIDLDPSTPGQQTSVTVPGKGTFELQPGGTVRFTPEPDFTGTVTLPYTVKDAEGKATNVALIQITVNPPAAPVAKDDSATTPAGTPVTLNPPANDVPAGGAALDPKTIDLDPATPGQQTSVTVPGEGTWTLNPDGTVTFAPLPGFSGTATLPYTIRDTFGQVSNTAILSVTVGAPAPGTGLELDKRVLTPTVTPGGTLSYELTVRNTGTDPLNAVTLTDPLPLGLRYVPGSSLLGGAAFADPQLSTGDGGRQVLVWVLPGTLAPGASASVRFSTRLTATVSGDSLENSATAAANGRASKVLASRVARARVQVVPGVLSEAPVLIGRVYLDVNADRTFQRATDVPVRGARVYLSNGRYAVTDKDGRYSFTDLPPGLYALRLDPLTAPYTPLPVPDDQGRPGTRYGRTPAGGGLVNEDFPLVAPRGDVNKARSTTVTRGPVKLSKTITPVAGGYRVTLTLQTTQAVTNLRITDPVPAGATRGEVSAPATASGAVLSGNVLTLPGSTPPGTRTLSYTLTTTLPAASVVTDPDLTWDEVQP